MVIDYFVEGIFRVIVDIDVGEIKKVWIGTILAQISVEIYILIGFYFSYFSIKRVGKEFIKFDTWSFGISGE